LGVMRATVQGRLIRTDAPLGGVIALVHEMTKARYVALVADAEPGPTPSDPDRAEALIALAQALNGPTRCALSTLRGGGNRSGADAVLTWQTGFPFAVDFGRGYPTYRPHAGAAERLAAGEVDAALVIGAPAAGGCRVTTPSRLRIAGGTVYDPANGVDGAVRDICIEGERIVAELPTGVPRLDVRGMVVMPGGVDIHAHVAGSSVNHARRLLPEEHAAEPAPAPQLADGPPARSGTGGTVPSTFATGYRYAGLGYTTAMEAAVAPLAARHAHAELDDTPIIDSGFYVLLGNDDYLLRQIAAGETARARDYAGWLLGVTRAYAIKIVNPGGGTVWKGW